MKDDVLAAAPATGARFEPDTSVAQLVDVLASVYYRLDADIDQLRRDRYVESATGRELDRRAVPLGVRRPSGESDDVFRRRALAGRARSTSRTTWDDFAEAVLAVLDAEPDEVELEVDYEQELGAVIVRVASTVLDESPFDDSEIVSLLNGALPMSRRVVIQPTDVATWDDPERGWGTQWGSTIE
jgi:hypothetical protein